jgi:hypothetical protein
MHWNNATEAITLPAAGTAFTYTAVYTTSTNILEITLSQTGGASSALSYTVNGGASQSYTTPFYTLRTDTVAVMATVPGTYEFVRWQDDLGHIVGITTTETLNLTLYASVQAVEVTAVFATAGNRLMVTLDSDPTGAALTYTIGTLNPILYTTPFPMERSEALILNAPSSHAGGSFTMWSDGTTQWNTATASVTLPATGTTVTFTAHYTPRGPGSGYGNATIRPNEPEPEKEEEPIVIPPDGGEEPPRATDLPDVRSLWILLLILLCILKFTYRRVFGDRVFN